MIHLNGRLVRATLSPGRDGVLFRIDLHDWDWSRVRVRDEICLNLNGEDQHFRVRSVTCCPGGEPEAWVWIYRIERPVEEDFPSERGPRGVYVKRKRSGWR